MPDQLDQNQGSSYPGEPVDMEKRIALAKKASQLRNRVADAFFVITLLLCSFAIAYTAYRIVTFAQ